MRRYAVIYCHSASTERIGVMWTLGRDRLRPLMWLISRKHDEWSSPLPFDSILGPGAAEAMASYQKDHVIVLRRTRYESEQAVIVSWAAGAV